MMADAEEMARRRELLAARQTGQPTLPKKRTSVASFEAALAALRKGKQVRRKGWHRDSFIFRLDGDVLVRLPIGDRLPTVWTPYSSDMLATDWEVLSPMVPV